MKKKKKKTYVFISFVFAGHNREPSEASSGGSDDSLEVDKLLKVSSGDIS